ncbi:unnamed protein product, partial [Staurois parvus]
PRALPPLLNPRTCVIAAAGHRERPRRAQRPGVPEDKGSEGRLRGGQGPKEAVIKAQGFHAASETAGSYSRHMGTDQDESGYQTQFNAAVSVIQSLPKSGSYRPSYEEMLLFYSYYKQATVGPCNIARPGFWDPIGRYKWDAWNKLGQMSQDDAMCAYIREMKKVAQKIINTIPLEDTTPEMFEPFRPLYEVIPDMPRPPDSFFKNTTGELAALKQSTHSCCNPAVIVR